MKTATHKRDAIPPHALLEKLTPSDRELYLAINDEIDFMDNPEFHESGAEDRFFGPDAEKIATPSWTHFPEVPEDKLNFRSKKSKLSGKEEKELFLRYNYARFRLSKLVEAQNRRISARRAQTMIRWYRRVRKLQSRLVSANMALVVAMAKRTRIPNVDFGEMISEGNVAMLRCVEKFDAARGFKFSTYACRAILKSFNRMATKTGKYRSHFPTEYDPEMDRSDYDVHKHEIQRDMSIESLRDILSRNRANLSDVERTIVTERFALGDREKKRTLKEVGKMVGLTNERVRQIQNLALGKIRNVLDEEYLVA